MVESHYLDPSLFKQTFFCKRKLPLFLSFSTLYFFNNISFQTCQFFLSIFNHLKIFFSFIQNKTPSYFEKETEWETIYFFVYFFRNWKHIFLFWQESNFVNPNKTIKFINTKNKILFFLLNHNTCVSVLLTTCKRDIRTEVFHVS